MKIFSGDFEIYSSGTLSSADLSDTRFVVSENPLMEIVCRISKNGKESGVTLEVLGESTIALVFSNPNGLGYGPASPVKVGRLNGKELYVSFRVSMRSNEETYSLDYTFYLKEGA